MMFEIEYNSKQVFISLHLQIHNNSKKMFGASWPINVRGRLANVFKPKIMSKLREYLGKIIFML